MNDSDLKLTREEWVDELLDAVGPPAWREHKYVGGPPPLRLRRMQLAQEVRARQAGIVWEMVDLRRVYEHAHGVCGICGEPVSFETFTVDHIEPISKGGPHVFMNLQPAHQGCNSMKGATNAADA